MPGILAITILFFLYALSEIIALRSNAVLSTVLGISVILTIGFWFNLLPKDIIQLAHIPGIGMLTVGMLLVSLGTTIDFAELRRQWKVAAVSVISVTMAVIFIIYLGPFFMDGALPSQGLPFLPAGTRPCSLSLTRYRKRNRDSRNLLSCPSRDTKILRDSYCFPDAAPFGQKSQGRRGFRKTLCVGRGRK